MANWNNNILEISKTNNEGGYETIKNIVQTKENTEDGLYYSLIGKKEDYTKGDHIDHDLEYYGTTGDVEYDEIEELVVCDHFIYLEFVTAWRPPIKFVEELGKRYKVKCELKYYELGNDFAGRFISDEYGVFHDKYNSAMEGLFDFDQDMFWYNLELMYVTSDQNDRDKLFDSLSSFLSRADFDFFISDMEEESL